MRRTLTVLSLTLFLMAVAAPGVQANEKPVRLTPQQETLRVDSEGRGAFSYSIPGLQLCYTLEVANLTALPTAAHIHRGARNVAGAVVTTLVTPPAATSTVVECITAAEGSNLTPTELNDIASNPRDFYVNVHTSPYPAGEVRGQLR